MTIFGIRKFWTVENRNKLLALHVTRLLTLVLENWDRKERSLIAISFHENEFSNEFAMTVTIAYAFQIVVQILIFCSISYFIFSICYFSIRLWNHIQIVIYLPYDKFLLYLLFFGMIFIFRFLLDYSISYSW